MGIKKADWVIIREAEEQGLVVGMTGVVEPERTELNNRLGEYFRGKFPSYIGSWGEYGDTLDLESVEYYLNEYLEEQGINKQVSFPYTDGSNIYLIPVSDKLSIKVVMADEYYGDGDYAKYVMIDSFVIEEDTEEKDVDMLIKFLRTVLREEYKGK